MGEVSVVIPVRGRPELLAEALDSLAADAPFEVIVVENGSRDLDKAELRRAAFEVRLLSLPAVGRSLARNAGVEAAETPLVAFLDSDDVSLEGRLPREVARLEESPDAALCFGRVEKIDQASRVHVAETEREKTRFAALLERGTGYESLLIDCPIYPSSAMVRREAFLAAGGFRVELDAFEDLDLFLRLAERGGLVAVDGAPVARHRLHPGNTPVEHLFAGSTRLAQLHLRDQRRPSARRLLVERELDGLWALDDFAAVRRRALRAVLADPALLGRRLFMRRLVGGLLPAGVIEALRGRPA